MVKLHANMHGYRPDRALDWLRPAMKVCAKYNIVVLIHTGDGPYTIPTMFYPIIREFPMVNFIIGHFGIQTGGNYSFEAFWMAMDTPNVYCESGWCFQSRIVEFAKQLPRDKIVFGTDSPPNEPGMWLRELEVLCSAPPQGLGIDEDHLEDYLGNNIARLVGIEQALEWCYAADLIAPAEALALVKAQAPPATTTLGFTLTSPATVTWTISDAAGRTVATRYVATPLAPGPYAFAWGGRDANGALVSVNLDIKNPNAKQDLEHLPPAQLADSILKKELRIAELMQEIKQVLAQP